MNDPVVSGMCTKWENGPIVIPYVEWGCVIDQSNVAWKEPMSKHPGRGVHI